MIFIKQTGIGVVLAALLLLLIVNPAIAQNKKDEAVKANQTLASMQQVNINEADADTLATLKGIGKDRALKIIEYREQNGPFQTPEDIMKVKGIGQKIFEQNKDFITI
jgi:competence protein ComEA